MSKPPAKWTLADLPRNNIEACRRYWETHEISGNDWRVMFRLQDDPAQLIKQSKLWSK